MQSYLEPPHRLPDEDYIREELLKHITNPDIKFILNSTSLPKNKKFISIIELGDWIVFSLDFELQKADQSIHITHKALQNKHNHAVKESMQIRNSSGGLYEN